MKTTQRLTISACLIAVPICVTFAVSSYRDGVNAEAPPKAANAVQGLPPVADISPPGGYNVVHLSIPPGSCAYPAQVRKRLADFLSDTGGPDGIHLLGAAGDCAGIARLMRLGSAEVSPSMHIGILNSLIDKSKHPAPADYRSDCSRQFPKKMDNISTDELRRSLADADKAMSLGQSTSLGRLDATPNAVFGGLLVEIARGNLRIRELEVVACFAPADVPLLWTFQENLDPDIKEASIADRLSAVLALAKTQVEKTVALNSSGIR